MKTHNSLSACCLLAAMAVAVCTATAADKPATDGKIQVVKPDTKPVDLTKPVKVFIMMGQSNMFGMGAIKPEDKNGTLEYVTKKDKKFPYLLDDAGAWSVRNDVRYVQVMTGKGAGAMQTLHNEWLTVTGKTIGPEIAFGHIMGQTIEEPVLLLKACIGNRSLGWDLLPPGSERYEAEVADKQGNKVTKVFAGYKDSPDSWVKGTEPQPIGWYAGKQYDDDTALAKKVLGELDKYYPGASKYEVAGFVWWQGHKDQNPVHASRYEQNLVNLIKSLRYDFNAPNAPFVLATIGFDGWKLKEPGLTIANAQLAMNDAKKHPEFAGNVKCVESRDFWKDASVSPTGAGYHYNGNAETYMEVGTALGSAMAELLKK